MAPTGDKPTVKRKKKAAKKAAKSVVKKKVAKRKVAKRKVAKRKAVARKRLEEVEELSADASGPSEHVKTIQAAPVVPSVAAVQETLTTRTTRTVRSRDVTVFLKQLIMLLDAGTPILKALKSLSNRGEHKGIRNLVTGISEYVEAGNPLWQAFSREGRHFSPVYVNLIKAAELSGTLTTVMRRLVIYREKREMMRRRMIVAMIYPVSVAVVAYIIIWLMSTLLIPEFEAMFKDFELELTPFTQFMLNSASFIGGGWSLLLACGIVAGVIGGYWLFMMDPVRRVMADRLKFKIPVLRGVTRASVVLEFTRTFAMLQRSGILIMSTLELCRNSAGNRAFAGAIQDMRDSVERGEGLERSLRSAERSGYLPGVVVDMLVTGEETGSMEQISDQIADAYEAELEIQVDAMKEAIVPVAVVGLSIVVGSVVIALFMPLVQMIEGLAGGGM
jgi:type IV pilus assembly protein PilC